MRSPERRGFGSRLQEEVIAAEFGGKVHIKYAPEGLRYELTSPMRTLTGTGTAVS